MSLYPSLEDMKVDQLTKAQLSHMQQQQQQHPAQAVGNAVPSAPAATLPYPLTPQSQNATLYPSLNEYMGLEITPELVAQYAPLTVAVREQNQVAVPASSGTVAMVAPLSGSSVGLRRAEVSHGIREIVLCKDKDGKIGVKVQEISKGIFVTLVQKNSPAALGGLRFGDQILQVNGTNVAGYDADKMHSMFKKCPPNNIVMAIRDRPFERTVTLHKDSTGHIGFMHKNGKIHSLVKDSSAARNGVLTDHQLLEVNGQNVVGLKEKDLSRIISEGGQVVTITIMPSFFYEHMMKKCVDYWTPPDDHPFQSVHVDHPNISASNRIIHAKDHASIQINIAEVDEMTGRVNGKYKTYAICGSIRRMGESDDCINRLAKKDGLLAKNF